MLLGTRFEPLFEDRRDAGRQLALALTRYQQSRAVVLALPRGRRAVESEVARALGSPLDVMVVRKLGVPVQAELGMGAVVDGAVPQVRASIRGVTRRVRPPPGYIEEEVRRAAGRNRAPAAPLPRRPAARRGSKAATAIVVDDGIATGGTVRAALRGLSRIRPPVWCWQFP